MQKQIKTQRKAHDMTENKTFHPYASWLKKKKDVKDASIPVLNRRRGWGTRHEGFWGSGGMYVWGWFLVYHDHNTQRVAGSYSQLFHLLHAHWHAAGLLGDKPAQRQGDANAQRHKINVVTHSKRTAKEADREAGGEIISEKKVKEKRTDSTMKRKSYSRKGGLG